jgi:hypothetical protein
MTSYTIYEVIRKSATGKDHNANVFYLYLSEQTYNFHKRGQAVLLPPHFSSHFEVCLSPGDVLPSVIFSAGRQRPKYRQCNLTSAYKQLTGVCVTV